MLTQIQKFIRSYGIVLGLAAGFAIGILYPSMVGKSNNMASSIAGVDAVAPEATNGTVCGLSQIPGNDKTRGMVVSDKDYSSAFEAYKNSHPDNPAGSVSWAGVIGKEYLIAVINSLPANETNVQFCFGTEANKQTAIYFKGGMLNPVNGSLGSTIMVTKTGADSYCPTHCPN